jgi:thioester reductase-like protein
MDLKTATVAVTGATGFLGRYLSVALLERSKWRHKSFVDALRETFAIEAAAQHDDAAGSASHRS